MQCSIGKLPSTTDDILFGHLSAVDLIAYSRTCKSIRKAAISFNERAFNIEITLCRYFTSDEILGFRELQATTGMIISGSTALGFFDRTEYANSDLDLYVDHHFREPIILWLNGIGYTFMPHVSTTPQSLDTELEDEPIPSTAARYPGAMLVLDFIRSNPQRRIQLITSSASPLQLVLTFHSTCVMNLITHNKAYSIFPRATFEERRSLIYVRDADSMVQSRMKYERRGWRFISEIDEDEIRNAKSAFSEGSRQLGDSKCWTIHLRPQLHHSPMFWEANSWRLHYGVDSHPMHVWGMIQRRLHFSYLLDVTLRPWPKPGKYEETDDEQDNNEQFVTEMIALINEKRSR